MSGASLSLQSRPGRRKAWSPLYSPAVGQWVSLAASTPSSGKWATWVERKTGNHIVQPDTDRQPAAGNAANGALIATFNGANVLTWPLSASGAGNNSTAYWAMMLRIKPTASLSGRQRLIHIGFTPASPKVICDIFNGAIELQFFNSATTGKLLTVASGSLTASAWQTLMLQWNGAGANDAAKVKAFKDGADVGGTVTDLGSPGTMTALTAPSGSILLGASSDSDTPATALPSGFAFGGEAFVLTSLPSAGDEQRLRQYRAAA